MLKISFKSSKKPNQILRAAETFFVRQGLRKVSKEGSFIGFQNAAGYVRLNVTHQSEVIVETVGLEDKVKQFAESCNAQLPT